ncbi:MAG: ThiF family adenylyltransferase, partial [Bradyrhizobium sp.]
LLALTGTHVALVADAVSLRSHSAQSAFVTAALLMARTGHCVYLIAPDMPMAGHQIPLRSGSLITELVAAGVDLLPGVEFSTSLPDHPVDLVVALGDTKIDIATDRCIRLNATAWTGSIERSALPWRGEDWPLGGMAAGALAAVEAFKCAIQKLRHGAHNPERLRTVFAPTDEVTYQLAPEDTPQVDALGAFDCISGGAIIHAALYVLSRVPNVTGHTRIIEPDTADLSNLNRYAILRRQDVGRAKGEQVADALASTGILVDPIDVRYDRDIRKNLRLAPAVLVGVDDIPTRWEVQRANPGWLAVGATTHWCSMASFHEAGLGCAECAHPYDDPNGGRIPTIAFVSFWAGLLTASYFLRHLSGAGVPAHEQQTYMTPLRAENTIHSGVPVRHGCRSCSEPSQQRVTTSRLAVA